MHDGGRRASSDMRRGFTLIEVLVALIVFEFGMLALAAAAMVAARDFSAASVRSRSRVMATNRVNRLRITACAAAASGSASSGRIIERWYVSVVGPARVITDTVRYPMPNGRAGTFVAARSVICPP